jgi:16S rRNA (guanine966-N2)-methyltransferase
MRVIGGVARGTRLVGPVAGTRPVSDRAREGLFASLGDRVPDAVCLDLFAGTGALGIEALSRGAARCTFVERSARAAASIRENLARTRLADRGSVVVRDVGAYLRRRPEDQPRVDLAFLDPPYEDAGRLGSALAALDRGWLAEGWTVVVTRGHKSSLPSVPVHWATRRQLRYGDSLVIAYQEVGWA